MKTKDLITGLRAISKQPACDRLLRDLLTDAAHALESTYIELIAAQTVLRNCGNRLLDAETRFTTEDRRAIGQRMLIQAGDERGD